MPCGGCAERAKLMRQMAQNIHAGKAVRPLVQQFGQTIKRDVVNVVRPFNPRLTGGRGR